VPYIDAKAVQSLCPDRSTMSPLRPRQRRERTVSGAARQRSRFRRAEAASSGSSVSPGDSAGLSTLLRQLTHHVEPPDPALISVRQRLVCARYTIVNTSPGLKRVSGLLLSPARPVLVQFDWR
jgi:hypothetical protein